LDMDINELASSMPEFNSHDEGREWFSNRFGSQFLYKDEGFSEGKHVFFYHIVKNQDAYDRYMASLTSAGKMEIHNMEPFESYTTVEIIEDGNVSISI
jgi:hypothetical protein